VAAITWLRPAAVTHAFNQDQRLVQLAAGPRGIGAQAIAPGDRTIAPPGPYMMFLVDGSGVPSHAAWVRTNLPPDAVDDVLERAEDREIPDLFERILANDVDVERDPTSVTIVDPPGLGQIVDGAYVPLPGASGDDAFTYTLSDGLDTSRVATVTIRITADGGCGCAAGSRRGALLGSILLVAAVAPLLARRRRSAR
jgi:hypothetical protein